VLCVVIVICVVERPRGQPPAASPPPRGGTDAPAGAAQLRRNPPPQLPLLLLPRGLQVRRLCTAHPRGALPGPTGPRGVRPGVGLLCLGCFGPEARSMAAFLETEAIY